MATLHVRNVPDRLYEMLKARAQTDGRSLSAEVLMILERALQRPNYSQRELLQSLQRRQRFSPAKAGAPSSLELLRAERLGAASSDKWSHQDVPEDRER